MRHAQSEGNFGKFFTGVTDVSITKLGHKQAQCSANLLFNEWKMPIDRIFCSPLRRARQTVAYTCDLYGLIPVADERLKEINGGIWEGRPHVSIDSEYPEERILWKNNYSRVKCPMGESSIDVFQRTKEVYTEIAEKYDGQNILVATHGTPILSLIIMCKDLPFETINFNDIPVNASITVIDWYGNSKYDIIEQNYHKHIIDAGLLKF